MEHEASVSKISDDQLFYLQSRGFTEEEAAAMIVNGFLDPLCQGAPHGIRRGTEPSDRTSDGRECGMMNDKYGGFPRWYRELQSRAEEKQGGHGLARRKAGSLAEDRAEAA